MLLLLFENISVLMEIETEKNRLRLVSRADVVLSFRLAIVNGARK